MQALDPYTERWRELYDSEPPPVVAGQLVYCEIDVLSIVKYGGMTQAEAESSMWLGSGRVIPALRGS